jgi:hypothetical protein
MVYRVLRIQSVCRSASRAAGAVALIAALYGVVAPSVAAEAPKKPQAISRFSQFPSKPGPQINVIRKMPAGMWLDLGPPAPDPKWGLARGRSWAANMAFAPSLGLAFLYGEGQHGWYDERTGRYMDDLWAYDIMGHRWLDIYPGTDVSNPPKLSVNKDGFTTLPNGNPVPIAILGHSYQMTAWDPDIKSFVAMANPHDLYRGTMPTIAAFMDANKTRLNESHASPWFYDTQADKWTRRATITPSPETTPGDTLLYIPSLKKLWFREPGYVAYYDPKTNAWQTVTPSGPQPPFGIDTVACYDSKRDRIYIGGGQYPVAPGPNALWIYDIRQNKWIDPKPKGSPGDKRYGTNEAQMHYDTASDTVLLFRNGRRGVGVYAYSPAKNTWTTVSQNLPGRWYSDSRTEGTTGFYDPDLNAHFFHVAGDSDDNGTIMVYRYKTAK